MQEESVQQKITLLVLDSYLAVINNSIGSKSFKNLYAKVNGERKDILRNGDLSCAFFVSSVLSAFKLIKEVHATVDSTVRDLKQSGWEPVSDPVIGSVIVWEKADFGSGESHAHVGFYVGEGQAVSNSFKLGYPTSHSWNFGGERKVELILWNKLIH